MNRDGKDQNVERLWSALHGVVSGGMDGRTNLVSAESRLGSAL